MIQLFLTCRSASQSTVTLRPLHRMLLLILVGLAPPPSLQSGEISFSRQIQPILAKNCFACHGPDEAHRESELRLDLESPAKEHVIHPGEPHDSELIARIVSNDVETRMPPAESGKVLTEGEIKLLTQWVAEGAAWSGHWAFETIQTPAVPDTDDTWPRNEIDHFVLQRMQLAELAPSPEADKRTLIRRLSLDLNGLPPTQKQVNEFLADTSDSAVERLIDSLLASDHFGERMAVPWLDGARYADTNGLQNDFYRRQWPWRDWVISAFNDNMPYDQFVVEQIAGDLLPNATDQQRIATGFSRNNHSVTEGGSIEEEWFAENVIDRISTVSTVFMGLTMGCARCHNHKYDPITQKDFYRFYAFFGSVDEKGFYQEARGNVGPQVTLASDEDHRRLEELESAIKEVKQRAKETETDLSTELKAARKAKNDYRKTIPTVMVMQDRSEMRPTYLLNRGEYSSPDKSEELWPDVPAFLPRLDAEAPKNRLGLARWLVSPNNPLVARVMVNRIWASLFGRGLVESLDNLGLQSTPPTHPDLLDWLARDFMEHGWDLKRLQKKIVMSSTYRQSSTQSAAGTDDANLWLSRAARFRLPAEFVRDNALAISGLLQHRIGGPSVKPYQPDGLWMELAGGANDGPYKEDGREGLYRKSLYTYRKRTVSHPTLNTFDAPNWETCTVSRATTNTPLQALALLNDTTYVESGRKLAERMLTEVQGDHKRKIEWAWQQATAKNPGPERVKLLLKALERYQNHFQRHPDDATEYIKVGASPVNDSLDAPEFAAWAMVASTILNLDEVITRE